MSVALLADAVVWVGYGLVGILAYVLISNAIYLLLGAKLLQALPGVESRGFRSTLRLALMLLVTVAAFILWVGRYMRYIAVRSGSRPVLTGQIASAIKWVSAVFTRKPNITMERNHD